jgi:hypothetical protein
LLSESHLVAHLVDLHRPLRHHVEQYTGSLGYPQQKRNQQDRTCNPLELLVIFFLDCSAHPC